VRTVFSKVLILSLFIILLAFVYKDAAFAEYTITSTKDYEPTSLSPTPSPSTSSPKIDENTKTITITFSGLVSDEEYFLCLKGDSLINCMDGIVSIGKPGSSDLTRNFCADSRDTLKLSKGDGKEECSEDDYFWAGHTYSVALIRKDPTRVVDKVPIYVSHYFPRITVSPDKPSNEDGEGIKVNIEGTRRKHDNENRNNYAVELHDQFGKFGDASCGRVEPGSSKDFILPKAEVGDYLIKINEQVNEGNNIVGNDCSAGYTYYTLGVRIRKGGGSFDKNPDGSLALIPDPNGTDLQGNEETFPTPPLPCLTLSQEGGGCDTVETAIGAINTNATGFIKSIFSLILGLSGGIALLLIIFSGYKLMAARGNPEALTEARDQLISAIIGLLFIIFSLVILQIIGVDILKIPGFGN